MNKIIIISVLVLIAIVVVVMYVNKDKEIQNNQQEQSVKNIKKVENKIESNAEIQKFMINSQQSNIKWSAQKVLIRTNDHYGKVNIKSGELEVVDGKLIGGELVVDMTTITSDDLKGNLKEQLEKHLKSEDFFAIEKYPEAKLTVIKATEDESQNIYQVVAEMTIKDKTVQVEFPAEIEEKDNQLKIQAELKIDRTKWGIRYGSGKFFDNLGNNIIDDMIRLKIELIADIL